MALVSELLMKLFNLIGKNFNDISTAVIVLLAIYWYIRYDQIILNGIRISLRRLNKNIGRIVTDKTGNTFFNKLFENKVHPVLKNIWTEYCEDFPEHAKNQLLQHRSRETASEAGLSSEAAALKDSAAKVSVAVRAAKAEAVLENTADMSVLEAVAVKNSAKVPEENSDIGIGVGAGVNVKRIPDIRAYFNTYDIITIPAQRKKSEFFPGVLITLGILFTFISVMLGMQSVKLPDASLQSLTDSLFKVITESFTAAVVAIIFGIIYQLLDKSLYQATIKELNNFLKVTKKLLPLPDETQTLELLLEGQQKQTDAVRIISNEISGVSDRISDILNTKLVTTVNKTLEDSIKSHMAPSLKTMSDMLYQLSQVSIKAQNESAQKMVDLFALRMNEALGVQFKSAGKSLEELITAMNGAGEALRHHMSDYIKIFEKQKEINRNNQEVLASIKEYSQQVPGITRELTANVSKMEEFMSSFGNTMKTNQLIYEKFLEQQEISQKASVDFKEKTELQLQKLSDDLSVQFDAMFGRFSDLTSVAYEKLETSLDRYSGSFNDNMKNLVDNLEDHARNLGLYSRELNSEISELNSKLEISVKEFSEYMSKGVVSTLENFDKGLAEVCGRLSGVIKEISDSVDGLPSLLLAYKSESRDK